MVVGGVLQDRFQLRVGESKPVAVGIRYNQSCCSRHVRTGHRGALVPGVAVAGYRAENSSCGIIYRFSTRGGDVHPGAPVGVISFSVLVGGGGHGKSAVVTAGIEIPFSFIVACGEDGDAAVQNRTTAVGVEIVDGVKFGLVVHVRVLITPTVLGDGRPVVRCPDGSVGKAALVLSVEDLAGHQAHAFGIAVPAGNAAYACGVVVFRGDGTGHVGAVVFGVDGGAAGHEVVAHPAPDVVIQVRMIGLDAAVDHCHDHVLMSLFQVPGFGQVDIAIDCSALLAGVVVMPLGTVIGVVGGPAV
ncbi:MAG: hypothetical protein BWX83_00960 [Candidatus Cloacimonetes bacterium ADurb.Bin117]|nr:MAG: hypothetical protein BWX83_00960 [Candidatus Cloacimonetes bacterium ADurb.Bin117]